jgi:hypothetical protein
VVSFGLLGAVWLWKRQPWGYVLAVIWNVNATVYMAALSAATVWAFQSGASEDIMLVALWGLIGVGACPILSFFVFLAFIGKNGHENSESGNFQYLQSLITCGI